MHHCWSWALASLRCPSRVMSHAPTLSSTPLLISLLSPAAVGINLTAASHIFLMEPCLNPALEEQAIGRCWRMGQQRQVVVKRFYTKDSVEVGQDLNITGPILQPSVTALGFQGVDL